MRQWQKKGVGIVGVLGICACSMLVLSMAMCSPDVKDPSDELVPESTAQVASSTVRGTVSPTSARSTATVEPTTASPISDEDMVANVPAVTPLNSAVNVRANPGIESNIVGVLQAGQQAVILEQNADSTWFRVALTDGTEGWVGSSVVQQITVTESTTNAAEPLGEDTAVRTYPTVNPDDYPASSPEFALAEFLQAWQNENWQKMAGVTQLTWRDGLSDPATDLRLMFGFKDLLGAEIGKREDAGEAWEVYNEFVDASGLDSPAVSEGESVASVGATLYYSITNNSVKTVHVAPMILREVAAYEPDPSGAWGINPLSMLKEVELTLEPTDEGATDAVPFEISGIETASFGDTIRYALYVDIVFPITEESIMEICDHVVEEFKQDRAFNAVAVYLSDLDAHYFGYTIARCDYAPNGNWSDAGEVSTGDYESHTFQYAFQKKVSEPETSIADMPSPQEMELCEEWMITADSLDEAGYDPVTESETEANRQLAEKYNMQATTVEDTVTKCIFWASR